MSSTNSSTELPHQQKHLTKHKRQVGLNVMGLLYSVSTMLFAIW